MIVKGIIDEDLINYRKPSMVIEFPNCDFKCDRECGKQVCQNSALATTADITILVKELVDRYIANDITQAIVCQGLEPMNSFLDLLYLVITFRKQTNDDIVIYTGYNKEEITDKIILLDMFPNIIIKYGRYIPDQESHFDELLGVTLASPNQYAEKIS